MHLFNYLFFYDYKTLFKQIKTKKVKRGFNRRRKKNLRHVRADAHKHAHIHARWQHVFFFVLFKLKNANEKWNGLFLSVQFVDLSWKKCVCVYLCYLPTQLRLEEERRGKNKICLKNERKRQKERASEQSSFRLICIFWKTKRDRCVRRRKRRSKYRELPVRDTSKRRISISQTAEHFRLA